MELCMLICHMTSAHTREDVRIFRKQCISLASAEYNVRLLVADGRGNEAISRIDVEDIGRFADSRFKRMKNASRLFLEKCRTVNADVFHFHDPELIPCGLKLKRMGKKVVYDVHEDVPRQILSKPYLNPFVSKVLSFGFERYENWAARRFDAIITATPHIRLRFAKLNTFVVDVNNYPIRDEMVHGEFSSWSRRKRQVCYVGSLSIIRGYQEMIEAADLIRKGKILVAGNVESPKMLQQFADGRAQNIEYFGFADRNQVKQIMNESMAGLVLLHPTPSYLKSLPIKMFEYMSAGIPVIASDFPLWNSLIQKTNCGLLVNPLYPADIARAIEWIFLNPAEAESMGKNGRRAVEQTYNWGSEEKKLLQTYRRILNGMNSTGDSFSDP